MSIYHGISPWDRLKAVVRLAEQVSFETRMEDPVRRVNNQSWIRG